MTSIDRKDLTKLSGSAPLSVQQCFLGEEYLLIVDGRFRERVKKIPLPDIEATILCPTHTGAIVASLVGLLGLFFLGVGALNFDELGLPVLMVILAAICFVIPIYLFTQGGSALLGVQTAVQTVIIEGAWTLRAAKRIEEKLRRKVESIQGELTEEALEKALPRLTAKPMSSASSAEQSLEVDARFEHKDSGK